MAQFGITIILLYSFAQLQEFILHLSCEIKRFHKFSGSPVFPKKGLSLDLPTPPWVFVLEIELPSKNSLVGAADGEVPCSQRSLTHANVRMSWPRP